MTLNDYVLAQAGRSNEAGFLHRYANSEIYLPVHRPEQPLPTGSFTAPADTALEITLANIGGRSLALAYTTATDPRLGPTFIGQSLREAARLVARQSHLDGLLLHSNGDAWFGVPGAVLRQFAGLAGPDRGDGE